MSSISSQCSSVPAAKKTEQRRFPPRPGFSRAEKDFLHRRVLKALFEQKDKRQFS